MVSEPRSIKDRLKFMESLRPYTLNEDSFSRINVDLYDLIEASEWLLKTVSQIQGLQDPDEIQNFLVDLDVHFIQHVGYHLKSLRKSVAVILKNFPDNGD